MDFYIKYRCCNINRNIYSNGCSFCCLEHLNVFFTKYLDNPKEIIYLRELYYKKNLLVNLNLISKSMKSKL